jgi:hypothetical protein
MTIYCVARAFLGEAFSGVTEIVIPTGAKRSGGTCGSFGFVR